MPEKLVVGPIDQGQRTNREPFVIDNDNFPVMINAYQWRGRVKRKRGTTPLGQLQVNIGTTDGSGNATITISPHPILPGIVSFIIGTDKFVDPGGSSPVTLLTNSAGTGVLNRTIGVLTITGSIVATAIIYYPTLPVMGLEDLSLNPTSYPGTLAFDTTYSYNIPTTAPYAPYNVSFYKNPLTGTYPSYVAKSTQTPLWWNGQNYQQFWSTNYQGAFWETNGIQTNPIVLSNVGMQFAPASAITYVSNTATTLVVTITASPLVVGDFVFANEWTGTNAATLNFQTGYVTNITGANITITFPNATLGAGAYTPGILQYLTNRSDTTKDCLRWYDGDPTNGTGVGSGSTLGWVNFMPPLFSNSTPAVTIDDLPPAQYYLVGARLILPFKDRLMFFGVIIQTSIGSPIYLQDTVIYSQNGTPYYTSSFTGDPTLSSTVFNPILVPTNQTSTANSYFTNITGYGGFVVAGVAQPIITVGANQDALIIGFGNNLQTKMIYTGNDVLPFEFYVTNSEMSSSSTFSAIVMNEGVISRGSRGYIITDQTGAQRIDLLNPDEVFEISLTNNGAERFTAQRDFIDEWIYFTYPSNTTTTVFPTQTFFYNYRDNSWAIFNESYTTYGQFRPSTGFTWLTIPYTWNTWNTPWNSGSSTLLQPKVIAGNQQGYIVFREGETTSEAPSLSIQNIVGQIITSPNHSLNANDFIIITGVNGAMGTLVNRSIFQVLNVTTNTFMVSAPPVITGAYQGGGQITRLYVPLIQTRQFPPSWGLSRKTRIGTQQYLLTKTDLPMTQITVNIYLSEDIGNPYNFGTIVPSVLPPPTNNSLIYSQTVFTSPEYYQQNVSRVSLGLIGNGVLTSFTFIYSNIFQYVELGIVPGSVFIQIGTIATFTDNGIGGFVATGTGTSAGSSIDYANSLITIAFTVAPNQETAMTNFIYNVTNIQNPIANSQEQIWHRMNTSLIGDTIQLGFTLSNDQMRQIYINGDPVNADAEIELHAFILDLYTSSLLS